MPVVAPSPSQVRHIALPRGLEYTRLAMESLFEEMKRFVRFTENDAASLRLFRPHAGPHLEWLVSQFYERILEHPGARSVFTGPEQVDRLKKSLTEWADRLLTGPFDETYYQVRSRIGRVHVRVGLRQAYMFMAMSVVREAFMQIAARELANDAPMRDRVTHALNKILDIELAMMQETYREDSLARLNMSERRSTALRLAAIGEVAASVAHEIRNPLAAINGTLDVLWHDLSSESPRRPVIREAMALIRQLDERIRDLLSYAREVRLVRASIDIEDLLRATTALLTEEPLLREVKLSIEVEDSVGPRLLDRPRIQEVLINLLINAGRAMKGHGAIRLHALSESDGSLSIAVVDNGPGIPPERASEIFRPFFTTSPDGTGLGLSISRKIVEAHGGKLLFTPAPEGGACFTILIPMDTEAA